MKIKDIIKLSFREVLHYKKRYVFLLAAVAFGFSVISSLTALKEGMTENIYNSARAHYAGDIVFMGYEADAPFTYHLGKNEIEKINECVTNAGIEVSGVVQRCQIHTCALFYNGEDVELKYLVGADWQAEAEYFKNLNYAEGGAENLNGDSFIISDAIAKQLGVKVGDGVLLEVENRSGQKNTANFILAASVNDNSMFNYLKVFIPLEKMNSLMGFEKGECSSIGVFLKNKKDIKKANYIFQKMLSQEEGVQTAALIESREDASREGDTDWRGVKIFIMPVFAYISEITQILDALDILILFLYVMLLIIIFVSASVTYSLLLHERSSEIATMRAIGFSSARVKLSLSFETFLLALFSVIAGFLLSLLFTFALSFISFAWFPSFEIFLRKGHLQAIYRPLEVLFNIAALYISLAAALLIPLTPLSKMNLSSPLKSGIKG